VRVDMAIKLIGFSYWARIKDYDGSGWLGKDIIVGMGLRGRMRER